MLNVRSEWTCVHHQGSSIVDLLWASAAVVPLVQEGVVWGDEESLSDHRYVAMSIRRRHSAAEPAEPRFPRWKRDEWDHDIFEAADLEAAWGNPEVTGWTAEEEAELITRTAVDACDLSMPRAEKCVPRRRMYWSAEIAALRRDCVHRRRQVHEGASAATTRPGRR